MRFGLQWYWRRRPSRGEVPPPANSRAFRPDAATTARGPRFSRQSNRSRGLRDWSARRAILIGTLSRAYHVVLQRCAAMGYSAAVSAASWSGSGCQPGRLFWWADRSVQGGHDGLLYVAIGG